MYATCLFCQGDLGRNDVLEAFPVGRRLAYDAAKGRLWVVCRKCERWNLTPLEERWEAIEQAERLYRGTRLRSATDEIGLARVANGLELVRIGKPERPELAAWRYGDQFGRRRLRTAAVVGAGVAAVGAVVVGGLAAGVGVFAFGGLIGKGVERIVTGLPNATVARVALPGVQEPLAIRRRELAEVRILPGEGEAPAVELRRDGTTHRWEGEGARMVLARLVPPANRWGATRRQVGTAVEQLVEAGDAERFLARFARDRAAATRAPVVDTRQGIQRWSERPEIPKTGLFALQSVDRLALEMAVHEEQERRAMEGELAVLEAAWREAEEIAAIADGLLLPESVASRFEELRGRPAAAPGGEPPPTDPR